MPKISEFFGIKIYMYFDDHSPPHFHAAYAEYEAVIKIDDRSVLRGNLPPRVLGLVVEWGTLHEAELEDELAPGPGHEDLVEDPAPGVAPC